MMGADRKRHRPKGDVESPGHRFCGRGAGAKPLVNVHICTSWDDGVREDLKLADLLGKYGIPSMFFIPATNSERPTISPAEIQTLSEVGEIGSHTLNHADLGTLPLDLALEEAMRGREYLEQVLGRSVPHFCYPMGHFNRRVKEQLKLHFESARTTSVMDVRGSIDGFHIEPTIHLGPRPKLSLMKHSLYRPPLRLRGPLLLSIMRSEKLDALVERILCHCVSTEHGPQFVHIWGHSWELEEFDLWGQLQAVFAVLENYRGCFTSYSSMVEKAVSGAEARKGNRV